MRLLALALLLQQADPHREKVDAGVSFPEKDAVAAAEKKSEWHKKVLKVLLDPAHWAAALKTVEERTGVKAEKLEIRVRLDSIDGAPAMGHGKAGRGSVTLDVDKLAKNEESAETARRLRAKGAIVLVPPARTDLVIPHELAHCFQGSDQPLWFLEGMASYVARDPNQVCAFRVAGQKVRPVDEEIAKEWTYARGWAFFEWLEAKHGAEKVKKFIALANDGRPAPEAAAEAAGQSWDAVRKAEREWSAAWVKSYKP